MAAAGDRVGATDRLAGLVLRLALAACTLVATAPATAADQARYEVDVDAPGPLKTLIQDNLSLIRWRDADGRRGRIDADQLRRLFDQGKDEIARLIGTEGYYAPTIDADLEEAGDHWIAHYRVTPNMRTTVDAVDLEFVGPVNQAPPGRAPDLKELRTNWTLDVGDVFRQAEWETNKRRLLQGFLIATYPFATMTRSEAQVDVRTSKAKLTVVIASGPAVRFGALQIEGLKRYPDETVRNLNTVEFGEIYTQQKIFDFQQKVANSGYFSRSEVSIEAIADPGSDPRTPFVAPKAKDGETPVTTPTPTPTEANAVERPAEPPSPVPAEVTLPLRVLVEENQAKTLSAGVGYTTNSGPRGSLAYNIINFLGGAKILQTNLAVDNLNQSLGANLLFPQTPRGDRYSISSSLTRANIQNEVDRTAIVSGKRAWGPETSERFTSIDYTYQQKDIVDIPRSIAETLGVTQGVTLRRTDNLLSPTTGYMVTAQAGAGIRVNNGKPYARVYGKGIRYTPFGNDNTLLTRLELGAVAGSDTTTLPTTLLFRAGGDGSVRGYGYQSLGVEQADAIAGGRYIATGSVEVIHWLGPKYPDWGVAGFVDVGNAANTFAQMTPVVGYGVGARWRSPVGTLDLDVAHGYNNGTTRIHFSLGVSF